MKNTRFMTGLSFMLALMMFNCNTPSNLLQEGDYDEAVYSAIKNLRKKKKKREKDIIVVEEAFRKITQRDMREIAALKAERQAANWVKINSLHNDIKDRQDLISPYLPLVATKTAYKADFRFVKIIPLELDSRKRAADYYYHGGQNQMKDALKGNKLAARSAYRKFAKVKDYFNEFKDTDELLDRSFEIGIDKVLLEMRNSSYAIVPHGFENELLSFNERNLDGNWIRYYKDRNAPSDIDYKVIVDITDIDVSPEMHRENAYRLTKELYRTETVEVNKTFTSNRVNSQGDSVTYTKPVREEIKVPYTVFADVVDLHQSKSAFVKARVSFYEAGTKDLIETENVSATMDFENIASTYRGDRRALNNAVRNRIGGAPVRYPTDSEMVLNTAGELKNKIGNCVRRSDAYVLR